MMGGGPVRGVNYSGSYSRGPNSRNLPYPEYLKCREEGRCFRFGGPLVLGTSVREELAVVLLAEDEEGEVEEVQIEVEPPCMELVAFWARGLTQPRTLQL